MHNVSFSSGKRLQFYDAKPVQVQRLMQELGISFFLATLLVQRNCITPTLAQKFLQADVAQLHDPFLLKDMHNACTRIAHALHNNEAICIYGDYDVDGAVATALLILFFRDLGKEVSFYIPCRQKEGYSLNPQAVHTLHARGVNLIITVDNGTLAHTPIALAQQLGIDVIVTDHHQVGETLPNAFCVINPQRKDCTYPFKGLCGAGVVFKLIMALRQHLRGLNFFADRAEPHLKQYFDLLCISTICDVVPLVDENRVIVKEGLKHLTNSKRLGLKALKAVCDLTGQVTATDVGFRMGPRLNAAGRLDDASHGVRLLTTEDPLAAKTYAEELHRLNAERRVIERDIVAEARHLVLAREELPLGLVVYAPSWHLGVVGIVASRLAETFQRPTLVLCRTENGLIKGSGRTFGPINLIKALAACAEFLEKFGGHEAAAGVTLVEENLPALQKAFAEAVQQQCHVDSLQKQIFVDAVLPAEDINDTLLFDIERLAPFGMGNPQPLFLSQNLALLSQRVVGEKHLKLQFKVKTRVLDAIAFNRADAFLHLPDPLHVAFHLERNFFKSQEHLQMLIREMM